MNKNKSQNYINFSQINDTKYKTPIHRSTLIHISNTQKPSPADGSLLFLWQLYPQDRLNVTVSIWWKQHWMNKR